MVSQPGDAEIDDICAAVRQHNYMSRLRSAMHQAMLMRRAQCGSNPKATLSTTPSSLIVGLESTYP
jgi:hypothetical protein